MPMHSYPMPDVSVDVVVFTLIANRLHVLLSLREGAPYAGFLALPGGYVHEGEDENTDATARRVLAVKAGLHVPYMEQLQTFSGKSRDPRGWSLSVAYTAVVPSDTLYLAHRDATCYREGWVLGGMEGNQKPGVMDFTKCYDRLVPVDMLPELPFDHASIVATGVARLRSKGAYSTLPLFLLPDTFTFREAHETYEAVMGMALDKVTFRRRIESQGLVTPTGGMSQPEGGGRPAQRYRKGTDGLVELDAMLSR